MNNIIYPFPRLIGAIIADVFRWYLITGSWAKAMMGVLVGLLDAIACARGECCHG